PGHPTPGGCRDTTGAGDAFHAGFIYGLLCGYELERTAIIANALASLSCRGLGARTALPTQAELDAFCDQVRIP
ncbi:MAG: carbohydrate kinase family protein, partial [Pyrinomonadaceae bacterium]